jgi:hypothetical protein
MQFVRPQEGIAVAEPHIQKCLVEFYRPTLTTIMEVFPDKAQYPPEEDWDDTWSEGPPSH